MWWPFGRRRRTRQQDSERFTAAVAQIQTFYQQYLGRVASDAEVLSQLGGGLAYGPANVEYARQQIAASAEAQAYAARAFVAVAPELTPLRIRGQFFELATGERWTAIEASDFNLLNRYLRDQDVDAILKQRYEVGFNLLRVWTAYELLDAGIGRLRPSPALYAAIPGLVTRVASYGLRLEFTAFTGPYQNVFRSYAEMDDHWRQLQQPPVELLELVNEGDVPVNALPLDRFASPGRFGLWASHGSGGSETRPVEPLWEYATFHTNGAFEWPRKTGHAAMEVANEAGVPVIANENTRAPDRFNSPTQAFDAAAGAALLCAGSCFHSVRGKSSEVWDGLELELATAWAQGARSVPLEFQAGRYVHRADLETRSDLRVYQRVLPDGRAWTVRIRR